MFVKTNNSTAEKTFSRHCFNFIYNWNCVIAHSARTDKPISTKHAYLFLYIRERFYKCQKSKKKNGPQFESRRSYILQLGNYGSLKNGDETNVCLFVSAKQRSQTQNMSGYESPWKCWVRGFFLWYSTIRIKWSGLWKFFRQQTLTWNENICRISQQ